MRDSKRIRGVRALLLLGIQWGLGALSVLAFAPFEWGALWLIPLLTLSLLLWIGRSPRMSGLSGFFYAFGLFSVGLNWIHISLFQYGDTPFLLAQLAVIALALFLSLYWGGLAYLLGRLHQRNRGMESIALLYGVLFPLAALLMEALRSRLFTGFPWLAAGYSLTDTIFAEPLFRSMGALASSFWVYLAAAFLLLFILALLTFFEKREIKPIRILLLPNLLLASLLFSLILVMSTLWEEELTPLESPLRVALLQGNVPQNMKFTEGAGQYLYQYYEMTREVIDEVDLVIWPETALNDIYDPEQGLERSLHLLAQEKGKNIIVGLFTGSHFDRFYQNSLLSFGPTLESSELYHKRKLLPFGEYLPFRSLLDRMTDAIPFSDLSSGEAHQPNFTLIDHGATASGSICYEAVFGEHLRQSAKESNLLINVSNDAWYDDSIGPWQHLEIARARAIEFGRPLARATNDGVTVLIDHQGKTLLEAPRFKQLALVGMLQPMQGETLYAKLGDWPYFIGGALLLLLTLWRLRLLRVKAMKRERAIARI